MTQSLKKLIRIIALCTALAQVVGIAVLEVNADQTDPANALLWIAPEQQDLPALELNSVKRTVILTGDGGRPNAEVLELLSAHSAPVPEKTFVVFAGDNVYINGFPDKGHARRRFGEQLLLAQIQAVGKAGFVFIPGNHDYGNHPAESLARLLVEQSFLEEQQGQGALLPRNGCPGPVEAFRSDGLRVIAINSMWWLLEEKPAENDCGLKNGFTDALSQMLNDPKAPRYSVLALHHPLETFGDHRSYVGRNDCPQSIGCPSYEKMRSDIYQAFGNAQGIICLAGHDHNLQVIKPEKGCSYALVSGALSWPTKIVPGPGLLFGFDSFGFLRLDLLNDGRLRLGAVIKEQGKPGREAYALMLEL